MLASALGSGCTSEPEHRTAELTSPELDTVSSFDISAGGRKFRINGVATFLLGVSYFTGLAATPARIHTDFTRLHGRGFNLVRVWALWNNLSDGGAKIELFNASGVINEASMTALTGLLDEARARNIIVDLTFDKTYFPAMSPTAYGAAIAAVAGRISGYRGVLIDLANEVKPSILDQTRIGTIRRQLPRYPGRIVTASVAIGLAWSDRHIPLLSSYVVTGGLEVADAHCCRDVEWPRTTGAMAELVRADTCCARTPIYFAEPNRCIYPGVPNGGATQDCTAGNALANFKSSAASCKAAGCAGWVFHTAASFFLNKDTLLNEYRYQAEIDAEAQLAGALDAVTAPEDSDGAP